ncbi:MAG: CHC2 zinc finger domain-containing protein [Candidatus Manganitrophus sp. SA1]|nr:CHC2 zinc finger domain-containing protein [Candidatus Manganitrophus morganii]
MPYPVNAFSEVKDRADILEIIQSETGRIVKGRGNRRFLEECPFCHGHGCFKIDLQKQLFNCFQCADGKTGGDVFDFVCKLKGWDKAIALKELAVRVGYQLPERRANRKRELREVIMAQAKADWALPEAKEAWDYLIVERQLSPEVLQNHDIGYIRDRTGLIRLLMKEGFSIDEIKATGILTRDYGDFYRILIGWRSLQGRVMGFVAAATSARLQSVPPEQMDDFPKYKNCLDFKVESPFNLYYAKHWVPEDGTLNIVEGLIDAFQMVSKGFRNTVGLGTNRFGEGYGDAISKTRFERLIVLLDADPAGRKGTFEVVKECLTLYRQFKLYVAEIAAFDPADSKKPIKDPDELIRKLGAEALRALLSEPLKAGPWLALYLRNKYDVHSNLRRDQFFQEMAEFWPLILDEVEKKETLRYLASLSGLPQDDIRKTIDRIVDAARQIKESRNLKEAPPLSSTASNPDLQVKLDQMQTKLSALKEKHHQLIEERRMLLKAYASSVYHINALSKGGYRWHIIQLTKGHSLIAKRFRKDPKGAYRILERLEAVFAEAKISDLGLITSEIEALCRFESTTEELDAEGIVADRSGH